MGIQCCKYFMVEVCALVSSFLSDEDTHTYTFFGEDTLKIVMVVMTS